MTGEFLKPVNVTAVVSGDKLTFKEEAGKCFLC
jgi:hypothetical protein